MEKLSNKTPIIFNNTMKYYVKKLIIKKYFFKSEQKFS